MGDFSTVWYLQSAYPELGMTMTMELSSEIILPSILSWFHAHETNNS